MNAKRRTIIARNHNPVSGQQSTAYSPGRSALAVAKRYGGARPAEPGSLQPSVCSRPRSTVYGPRSASAFTLVELLVVISIMALLLGIIVPSYFSIREKAKYTKAKVTAKNLEIAFKAYLDHYRVWPSYFADDDSTTLEIGGAVGTADEKIFRILRGENIDNNNKDSIPFYEFEGTNSAAGALDPWSNPSDPSSILKPYRVRVDKNYDNKIDDLYRTVIVWSVGTNRSELTTDPATTEGNVKSWD